MDALTTILRDQGIRHLSRKDLIKLMRCLKPDWGDRETSLLQFSLSIYPDPIPIEDFTTWLFTPVADKVRLVPDCSPPGGSVSARSLKRHVMSDLSKGGKGDFLRGVSVWGLKNVLEAEVISAGLNREDDIHTIAPPVIVAKGQNVTCPRDGGVGAAYVDCLDGEDIAGRASVMLSYSWGYPLSDIVDSLEQWCTDRCRDTKRVYVWICCLCINQHRVEEKANVPFEEFRDEFKHRVEGIKHVVALMTPWKEPGYLKRVWCIFELFVATINDEVTIDVIMPPQQRQDLYQALLQGRGADDLVWKALGAVHVENASAHVQNDKHCIMKMIDEPEGPGFQKLNSIVAKHLQVWIVETAESFIDRPTPQGPVTTHGEKDVTINLYISVSVLLNKVGSKVGAMKKLKMAEAVHMQRGSLNSLEGADLLTRIGRTHGELGEMDQKLAAFDRARQMYRALGATQDQAYADLLFHIGFAQHESGHFDEALDTYQVAEGILSKAGLHASEAFSKLLMNRALSLAAKALRRQETFQEALDSFKRAQEIRECLDMLKQPGGAGLLKFFGDALRLAGDLAKAMDKYELALEIQQCLGVQNTTGGAGLLDSMAIAYGDAGKISQMFDAFERAWKIRVKTSTAGARGGMLLKEHILEYSAKVFEDGSIPKDQSSISLYNKAAKILFMVGEKRKALTLYANAQSILLEQGRCLECQEGAKLVFDIGRIEGELGDQEKKMVCFESALSIFKRTGTLETEDGATLLISLGWAKSEMNDPDGALSIYEEARTILDDLQTAEKMPRGRPYAHLLMNIGVAQMKKGHFRAALEALEQSKKLRERIGMQQTGVLKYIGDVYTEMGSFREADQTYGYALNGLRKAGLLNRAEHAAVLASIGNLKGKQGQLEEQQEAYLEARNIRQLTGTLNAPAGKTLLVQMRTLGMADLDDDSPLPPEGNAHSRVSLDILPLQGYSQICMA